MAKPPDSTREVQLVYTPRGGGALEKTEFGVKKFSAKIDEMKKLVQRLQDLEYCALDSGCCKRS